MPSPLTIDRQYLVEVLGKLIATPSPTGFTERGIQLCADLFENLRIPTSRSHKGALLASWPGRAADSPRAACAHIDTLGAMVREIKPSGRLKLSNLGGFAWNTVENEGLTVFTSLGQPVRGSLLLNKASGHVHGKEVGETERSADTMEVRLDVRSSSPEETRTAGIEVGDFVAFDPRFEVNSQGFVRARHLDNKAGVACILAAISAMQSAGLRPAQHTSILISNYEEVGHGAAVGLPTGIRELVAVDMAPVGEGQTSDEFRVTICAKDSSGPYDDQLTRHLRHLAQQGGIPNTIDTYPHYGSDASAFWRAGGDARAALIGPGVDASHSYERTHLEALSATAQLLAAYLAA